MLKKIVKKLGTHSLIYGFGIFSSKATSFFMIPIYTTYLDPTEYGIIGILDFTAAVVSGIIGLRISNAVILFYSEAGKREEEKVVISTATVSLFLIALIVTTILCLLSPVFGRFILRDSGLSHYFVLIFISMGFQLISETGLVYMRILEKSALFTGLSLFKLIISVSLNIYMIVFLEMGILGFLYSGLIMSIAMAIFCGYWSLKKTGIRPSALLFREMAKYSAPLIPASFFMSMIHSADVYILTLLSGVFSVGLYSLAYKFGMILSDGLLMPFGLIWGPMVYRVIKQKNGKVFIARICTFFCAVSVWAGLLIALFAEDLIHLMADEKFWESHLAVPFILLGYVLYGLSSIFHFGSLYKKKTIYSLYSNMLAAFTNISLNFLIIPLVEVKYLGAAMTTTISFLILAVCRLYFSNKIFPISYETRKLGLLIISGAILYSGGYFITFDSVFLNIFFKMGLVGLFPLTFIFIKIFEKEELLGVYSQIKLRLLKV